MFSLDMEKAMAAHSSTLAWQIPWTEEPGRLQSMGSLESDTTERLHFHFSLSCIGEGHGNPLQRSCLCSNMLICSSALVEHVEIVVFDKILINLILLKKKDHIYNTT